MNSQGFVKIGDFGLAITVGKANEKCVVGTKRYLAPERIGQDSGEWWWYWK